MPTTAPLRLVISNPCPRPARRPRRPRIFAVRDGMAMMEHMSQPARKRTSDSPPKRGRPPGSKSAETTPFKAKVYTALTPEQRRELEKLVLRRRLDDETLPSRYGISDLLREIVEEHLAERSTAPKKPARKPSKSPA